MYSCIPYSQLDQYTETDAVVCSSNEPSALASIGQLDQLSRLLEAGDTVGVGVDTEPARLSKDRIGIHCGRIRRLRSA